MTPTKAGRQTRGGPLFHICARTLATLPLLPRRGRSVDVHTLPPKNTHCTLKELIFPLLDLVGMNIKLLSEFSQCLLTANGGKSHL